MQTTYHRNYKTKRCCCYCFGSASVHKTDKSYQVSSENTLTCSTFSPGTERNESLKRPGTCILDGGCRLAPPKLALLHMDDDNRHKVRPSKAKERVLAGWGKGVGTGSASIFVSLHRLFRTCTYESYTAYNRGYISSSATLELRGESVFITRMLKDNSSAPIHCVPSAQQPKTGDGIPTISRVNFNKIVQYLFKQIQYQDMICSPSEVTSTVLQICMLFSAPESSVP